MKLRTLAPNASLLAGALLALGTVENDLLAAAPPKLQLDEKAISRETKLTTSFAPIVKKAAPSVVNIYSTKTIKESRRMSPLYDDPFFRRFFDFDDNEGGGRNSRPRTREEQSLGSGVIISEDGYILTNNHVVEGADDIRVALANGDRHEFTAKIIGTDPQTDIAVIKIEDTKKFAAVTIGDSDKLEVGDAVLAIGNPFGVGQTVTMGIVSATGRGGFGIVDYEDFIQTDASINPGNSGGALIDAEGRLIGINSVILSRSGGNQGVGFAIPINMARAVMARLVSDGKFVRGFLGVNIQNVTSDIAKEFKLGDQGGALVGGVNSGTPAAQAGLKEGDVIIEFNGKKITDSRHLRLLVAQTPPKTKVTLKALRDGKEKSFNLTLGELPKETAARTPEGKQGGSVEAGDVLDGVEVTDLNSRARRQIDLPTSVHGALVTNVDPSSPAARAGLRPGDVIMEINRKPVNSADDAVELSDKTKGERILLRVWGQGGSRYLIVAAPKSKR